MPKQICNKAPLRKEDALSPFKIQTPSLGKPNQTKKKEMREHERAERKEKLCEIV